MATSDEAQTDAVKPDKGDSKDFVEHLRTVHFTLVTVCLALIVILQFPSPVSIREAIHQLNTIVDATHVWKDTWVDEGVPKELNNKDGFFSCVNPVTSDFATAASGTRQSFHFQNVNWTLRTSNPMPINSQYMTNAKYMTIRHTTIDAPKRLDEFKNIWNNSYSILCPVRISDEGVNLFFTAAPKNEIVVPIKREAVSSAVPLSPAMLMDNGAGRKFDGLHKGQSAESEGLFYSAGFLPIANPNISMVAMAKSPTILDIPVLDSKVFPFDYRGVLIKELPQYNWLHADFKDAFYELDQATTGFQDLDFDHIKQILQQNQKNSKEAFQAFGVTFPIETTAKWGTLIIIVIQFYFLLHLMEYGKNRTLAKPDVAWIGIYASPGARILFCATALVLPLAVITFVCIKDSFLSNMPIRNALLCVVAVSASAFLSFFAAKQYFKKDAPIPTSKLVGE